MPILPTGRPTAPAFIGATLAVAVLGAALVGTLRARSTARAEAAEERARTEVLQAERQRIDAGRRAAAEAARQAEDARLEAERKSAAEAARRAEETRLEAEREAAGLSTDYKKLVEEQGGVGSNTDLSVRNENLNRQLAEEKALREAKAARDAEAAKSGETPPVEPAAGPPK